MLVRLGSWFIALVLGCAVLAGTHTPTSAQDSALGLPVYSIACDTFVQMANTAKGEGIPATCRALAGVTFSAADRENSPLATCTTGDNGMCKLDIPLNGLHIITQSKAGIPDGYAPLTRVQRQFTYTEFAEVHFENYLAAVIPTDDVQTATMKVQSRVCPDKYAGDDFASDCGELIPPTDQLIFANTSYNTTGKDGNATLREVPIGDVAVIGGQSATTGDVYFSCFMTKDPTQFVESSVTLTVEFDGQTRDFVGHVNLGPKENITCLWYQIPNLDRGLWTTLDNKLAPAEQAGTWVGESGALEVYVLTCPADVVPKDLADATGLCKDKVLTGRVSLTGETGGELISGALNVKGMVRLDLSGKPIQTFNVNLDGRTDLRADIIGCFAKQLDTAGDETEPLYQWASINVGSWSIPGFGDDQLGTACFWYLVG